MYIYTMPELLVLVFIGLVSGLVAYAFLKIIAKVLGKSKQQAEAHDNGIESSLRKDFKNLNEDIKQLREERELIEKKNDVSRDEYWRLYDSVMEMKTIILSRMTDPVEIDKVLRMDVPNRYQQAPPTVLPPVQNP